MVNVTGHFKLNLKADDNGFKKMVVKFFISIFCTKVYTFHNTFIYVQISGIYCRYFLNFVDKCKMAPFLFKGRCSSFATPQKKQNKAPNLLFPLAG